MKIDLSRTTPDDREPEEPLSLPGRIVVTLFATLLSLLLLWGILSVALQIGELASNAAPVPDRTIRICCTQ